MPKRIANDISPKVSRPKQGMISFSVRSVRLICTCNFAPCSKEFVLNQNSSFFPYKTTVGSYLVLEPEPACKFNKVKLDRYASNVLV